MGMSNEQFNSYKKAILRHLERAEENEKEMPKIVRQLAQDMRDELQKP